MRIWSLHPRYLDPAGLVALWRETLLARAVLRGATTGYRNHPQLDRFQATPDPVAAIDRYLSVVYDEACARGYAFDESKFVRRPGRSRLLVTSGQLAYEWQHLSGKLRRRHPERYRALQAAGEPGCHPIFRVVSGDVEAWERRGHGRFISSPR